MANSVLDASHPEAKQRNVDNVAPRGGVKAPLIHRGKCFKASSSVFPDTARASNDEQSLSSWQSFLLHESISSLQGKIHVNTVRTLLIRLYRLAERYCRCTLRSSQRTSA